MTKDARRINERRTWAEPVAKDRRQKPRRACDVEQEWLTISGYAKKYNANRRTVYKWIAAGLLTTFKVGYVVRVKDLPPEALRA